MIPKKPYTTPVLTALNRETVIAKLNRATKTGNKEAEEVLELLQTREASENRPSLSMRLTFPPSKVASELQLTAEHLTKAHLKVLHDWLNLAELALTDDHIAVKLQASLPSFGLCLGLPESPCA